MQIDGNDSLGPQCCSCSKRRIRCDSTTPHCERCRKDDISCPGYKKPLKWTNRPSRPRKTNRVKQNKATTEAESQTVLLLQPASDEKTRTNRLLIDVLEYYNARVLPQNMPCHPPFRRTSYNGPAYLALPSILQHLIIVTYRTVQFGNSGCDPLDDREICRYRGLALTELNRLLSATAKDPIGLILSSAIMALLADFGLSQEKAWRYHLQGTRELIRRRGGFTACLNEFPGMRTLLLTFLMMDVLTATLASTQQLDSALVEMQAEYIPLLPQMERDIVANTDAYPHILLQAIIRATALRARSTEYSTDHHESDVRHEVPDLLGLIIDFDPYLWASQVMDSYTARPLRAEQCASERSTKAWAHLALCYKSAALLYFFYSVAPHSQGKSERLTKKAYDLLSKHSQILFNMAAPDPNAEIETQLWKFLNWPILMSIYVSTVSGSKLYYLPSSIDRMKKIAEATGIRSWLNVACQLSSQRQETPSQSSAIDRGLPTRSTCSQQFDCLEASS